MSKVICNALCLVSTIFSIVLVLANSSLSADFSKSKTVTNESATFIEQDTQSQLTSVSQLSDIKNTDWSLKALKSLIERYPVVGDNFDNILQGNQSVTRYEFAVFLNAAINRLNELITKENADLVLQEDLATIQQWHSDFTTELATLQRRVDNVEVVINQLAAQQFSPTAKLTGEVIFALSGAQGDKKADDDDEQVDENFILSDRVWLNFDMSFTGRDRLLVRLEAENTPSLDDATGTQMTRLGFLGDSDNEFDINQLEYRFFISQAAKLYITTDSTAITPGLLIVTNPEHNENNDAIYVGTVRTTFMF